MSIRNLTLVMLVLVTGSATGCGGMRNFLFGRGASCGLCNRIGAAGNALNPLAPAPGMAAPTAGCGTPGRSGCGLFNRNRAPAYAPPVAYAPTCNEGCGSGYVGGHYGDGGYAVGMVGDCESCNTGISYGESYGGYHEGVVTDPYLGSPSYGSPVMGGEYPVGGTYQGGVIQGDNFYDRNYSSRKVDSQGDVIVSESPLPPGAQLLN